MADGDFAYTKYDKAGRVIETGLGDLGGTDLGTKVNDEDFPTTNTSEETYFEYDVTDSGLSRSQRFTSGRLSKAYVDGGVQTTTTWYSYDELGRVEWTAKRVEGMNEIIFIDYFYDLLGNITEVRYNEGEDDEFRHHYAYEINGQLTNTSFQYDNNGSGTVAFTDPGYIQAAYSFTADGALDIVNLGNGLQKQQYAFTISGQLKAVNPRDIADADLSSHDYLFSQGLYYHSNDYAPANGTNLEVFNIFSGPYNGVNSYSGNIGFASWKARATIGSDVFDGYYGFAYEYDQRNQF